MNVSKEKNREYHQTYFRKNPEKVRELNRNRLARFAERNRNFLAIYKASHPCERCGEDFPPALDFHHKDPETKSFGIAQTSRHSMKQLLAETAKCEVLCATCHRKETFKNHSPQGNKG